MEGIGGRDHHGIQRRIGQHRVVVGESFLRCMGGGHALQEIRRDIADGVESVLRPLVALSKCAAWAIGPQPKTPSFNRFPGSFVMIPVSNVSLKGGCR